MNDVEDNHVGRSIRVPLRVLHVPVEKGKTRGGLRRGGTQKPALNEPLLLMLNGSAGPSGSQNADNVLRTCTRMAFKSLTQTHNSY